MALVHVQAARAIKSSQMIEMVEDYMSSHFKLKRRKASRYLTENQFKFLFPEITDVKAFLLKSSTVHGFVDPYSNQIKIHPEAVFELFRKTAKERMKLTRIAPEKKTRAKKRPTMTSALL